MADTDNPILKAIRKVPRAVYETQLDAIESQKLRDWLVSENLTEAKDDGNRVGKLLQVLGSAWPLDGSRYPYPDYLSEPSPTALSENSSSAQKESARNVSQLLLDLLQNRGRTSQRLSHRAKKLYRSVFSLPESWENLHKADFGRLGLEFLAGFCLDGIVDVAQGRRYREMPLKILVVDNRPEEIATYNELLPVELGLCFWKKADWYVVSSDFKALEESLGRSREVTITARRVNDLRDGKAWAQEAEKLAASEIDIVLQDHSLGPGQPNGLQLARAYLGAMPQALVFLTTGLPIETLTATESLLGVDRILRKSDLVALPWYYHLAFTSTLGAMFWEAWLAAEHDGPFLERRSTLRNLLGSIRRWLHEPEILWHGQALPEMVDHGHAHISDLWRLTNEILGARKDDISPAIPLLKPLPEEGAVTAGELHGLSTAERVLLALGIWLHDIGHRGDEHCVDPASIRDVHGSISERLILEDPAAFGLEWLISAEALANETANELWLKRNSVPENGVIPAIRLAGLLCRHHQSSAPLIRADIGKLHFSLKFPSDYARTAWIRRDREAHEQTHALPAWRDLRSDLDWLASDVRALEDFAPYAGDNVDLVKCGCLLRLLDAMHLHRCRAGSPVRIETHKAYRRNRERWVENRVRELEDLMSQTPAGSKAYLAALGERLTLESYYDLLTKQDIHLWRQAAVESLHAKFLSGHEDVIQVTYRIRPNRYLLPDDVKAALAKSQENWKDKIGKWLAPEVKGWLTAADEETRLWAINLLDDVLKPELQGQCFSKDAGTSRYTREPTTVEHEGATKLPTYLRSRLFDQPLPDLLFAIEVVPDEQPSKPQSVACLSTAWEVI